MKKNWKKLRNFCETFFFFFQFFAFIDEESGHVRDYIDKKVQHFQRIIHKSYRLSKNY